MIRQLLIAAALVAATLAPLPVEAQENFSCPKDGSFDTIIVAARIDGVDYGTCMNGGSGGLTESDLRFLLNDARTHPETHFGVSGTPTKLWYAMRRAGDSKRGPWVKWP